MGPDFEITWYQEIFLAYLLDLAMGDPKYFPHPVRWMGKMAGLLETVTRKYFRNPFVAGWVTTLLILFMVIGGSWGLLWLLGKGHPYLGIGGSVYLIYTCLSVRSLYDESKPVAECLRERKLDEARVHLSQIVGRDTDQLEEKGITRATVETVAENTIDGIVAPLLYACLGGAPLALGYKAINTLDSLFGYRTEAYEQFGKFPARLDDAANWIPARLGGAVMVAAAWMCGYQGKKAWSTMIRDGGNHPSPNAGIPEAVMAGALGIQLGGPNVYQGVSINKPFIGDPVKEIDRADIGKSHRVMFVTSFLSTNLFVLTVWGLGIR